MNLKLDDRFFDELLLKASASPRKRSHYNLHQDLQEPVQRLCIGLIRGTYVRPHHHPDGHKWELMLVLRGQVALIIFDKQGTVLERLHASPGDTLCGIELKPDTWHTLFPLSAEAVIMEIKQGPFTPTAQNHFAAWAPDEGHEQTARFLDWLQQAKPGDQYPA